MLAVEEEGDINSDPGPGVHWGAGANTRNVRGGG